MQHSATSLQLYAAPKEVQKRMLASLVKIRMMCLCHPRQEHLFNFSALLLPLEMLEEDTCLKKCIICFFQSLHIQQSKQLAHMCKDYQKYENINRQKVTSQVELLKSTFSNLTAQIQKYTSHAVYTCNIFYADFTAVRGSLFTSLEQ